MSTKPATSNCNRPNHTATSHEDWATREWRLSSERSKPRDRSFRAATSDVSFATSVFYSRENVLVPGIEASSNGTPRALREWTNGATSLEEYGRTFLQEMDQCPQALPKTLEAVLKDCGAFGTDLEDIATETSRLVPVAEQHKRGHAQKKESSSSDSCLSFAPCGAIKPTAVVHRPRSRTMVDAKPPARSTPDRRTCSATMQLDGAVMSQRSTSTTSLQFGETGNDSATDLHSPVAKTTPSVPASPVEPSKLELPTTPRGARFAPIDDDPSPAPSTSISVTSNSSSISTESKFARKIDHLKGEMVTFHGKVDELVGLFSDWK